MTLIQQIAEKRQLLLDAIEANGEDINLGIFEDFYPDEAHFIFELLQNAEDAGATEAAFELTAQECSFEHNGTRHFNEQDIRGITGIFNSSKRDDQDKIGKFGVGFKSVFVYTDSPVVYSGQHSFRIERLILPKEVAPKPGLGNRTRFEFPFNNPKKNASEAFLEVKFGLEQLSENALLFLRNLGYIKRKIESQEGALLREEHGQNHVEVLKQIDGKEVLSSHWLRFSAPVQLDKAFLSPVEGLERQQVAIAFELAFAGNNGSFDKRKPIAEQLKVVPSVRGKVSVFFPADKETSGLRFHLHGPFLPELSRASIKNSPENLPLFEQLATLSASSLHTVKKLGLLTADFLAVLPNADDELPERYQVIRRAIIDEMKSAPLVPTHSGSHAPAKRLLQAKASLKALLTKDDLTFVTEREDQPEWAIGASLRNSQQDRLLSSLDLQVWDAGDLQRFFENRAREGENYWDDAVISPPVLEWLQSKSNEWLQSLYALLLKHCEDEEDFGQLDKAYIVKLASGELSTASESFFKAEASSEAHRLKSVDEEIFSAGTKKQQQQDARKFLAELGVGVPNEADVMAQLIADFYSPESTPPNDVDYRLHLESMISFLERNPAEKGLFEKAHVFKVTSLKTTWAGAESVYLDQPYVNSGLKVAYSLPCHRARVKRWPLDEWYQHCGIAIKKIVDFAHLLGCQREFDQLTTRASCDKNPNWPYLRQAPGGRAGNVINRDFALTEIALELLRTRNVENARLVWGALCRSETIQPTIMRACFRYTEKGGPHYSESQLAGVLKELAWVPQADGTFVKPSEASGLRLPEGFTYDSGHKWLRAIGFGSADERRAAETETRTAKRTELGFNSEEELQRALIFINRVPPEEQARILAEASTPEFEPIELPERPVANAALRGTRAAEEAKNTPTKETEIRERSVPIGASDAITPAKLFLQAQYTNSSGKMICQVCKDELPFRLPSGSHYFEAIELIRDSKKRHRATYLALCPNHAAAYQYANGQRNAMAELVDSASSTEIEISLGGVETTIYFTETHLADAKACIQSDKIE